MIDIQEQVIIGAVLGGSSLIKQPKGRHYYLMMRSKDPLWLQYKIAELHNFFSSSELSQQNNTHRCSSICSKEFTELHQKLYCGKKRFISIGILDKFRDIGLAIWFLESGGFTGRNRKNAYLNTTLIKDTSYLACDYFNSMDIKCKVHKTKERQKILFSVQGTSKLLRIIAPKFPNFIYERMK